MITSRQIKYYGIKKIPCKIKMRELAIGIKVEREHTHSNKIAKAIALAHLCGESPVYYSAGLIPMERRLKKISRRKKI